MSGDRAVCFVCAAIFGALLVLPAAPEPAPIIKPDSYRIAESFGCMEVLKTCRVRMRGIEIRERKHDRADGRRLASGAAR